MTKTETTTTAAADSAPTATPIDACDCCGVPSGRPCRTWCDTEFPED